MSLRAKLSRRCCWKAVFKLGWSGTHSRYSRIFSSEAERASRFDASARREGVDDPDQHGGCGPRIEPDRQEKGCDQIFDLSAFEDELTRLVLFLEQVEEPGEIDGHGRSGRHDLSSTAAFIAAYAEEGGGEPHADVAIMHRPADVEGSEIHRVVRELERQTGSGAGDSRGDAGEWGEEVLHLRCFYR